LEIRRKTSMPLGVNLLQRKRGTREEDVVGVRAKDCRVGRKRDSNEQRGGQGQLARDRPGSGVDFGKGRKRGRVRKRSDGYDCGEKNVKKIRSIGLPYRRRALGEESKASSSCTFLEQEGSRNVGRRSIHIIGGTT